ncbi:unnamed protein product [Cuscuta campestris]|uniref:DUF4283 domain-containing protein n=1 Tax=Cuscuta campestris TaxID=132261 RepID=A0A484M0M8_9ASTE|nr:unnamed protein product [Cuscuta campestris]
MTFTLRGTRFDIPVLDLGRLLGIYTPEETSSPDFLALPHRLPLDVDVKAFWRTHSRSTRDFSNKYSSSSDWRSPAWRILSHLLCCSYFGRHKNANRVYDTDLIFFWSLESHTPAGPIITLLVRALVPTIVIPDHLPEESSVRPITLESLIHMGFRKRPRDTRYEPDQDTGTGSPSYMPASMPADGASSSAVPRPLPTTFEELTTAFGDLQTSIDSRFQLYEQRWTAFEHCQETCWKEIQDHQHRIETSLADKVKELGRREGFYNGIPSISFTVEEEDILESKMNFSAVGRFNKEQHLSTLKAFMLRVGFSNFKIRRINSRDILFTFKNEDDYIRFLNAWLNHHSFLKMVSDHWDSSSHHGGMDGLAFKLHGLKRHIKEWNIKTFGNVVNKLKEAEETAIKAQEQFEKDPTPENRELDNKAKAQLIRATENDLSFWKQKANLKWMEEGDCCSKFFHSYVKARRSNHQIRSIMDEKGKEHKDMAIIKQMAIDYYSKLYNNSKDVDMEPVLHYLDKPISHQDNINISKVPNEEEIKEAVWSLNPNSAPGPDGFNGSLLGVS